MRAAARRGQHGSAKAAAQSAGGGEHGEERVESGAWALAAEVVERSAIGGQVEDAVDAFGTNLVIQAFQHKLRMCFVALNRGYRVDH